MDSEKRNFARLDLHAKANIHLVDQNIEGELENVSMKGAFVTAVWKMGINDMVTLTIDNTPTCNLKAKVVRVTDKGIGLQFEKTLFN
jgi:hypothetical protein